ncbi:hypothetical protein [Streptomyces sp. WMMB 322]|uniref:hypothetical protein n=1 Tax=Streptomyces sp. WMMB 322 TaxID=1286821 RepID=UPI000823BE45|nr:hypothetical protein [Streptomyces sp. WMMB 322]SCK49573.1 hypothetical protein H180DRAFT_04439 [Streptomyces sp. WMMB 322]
MTGCIRRLPVRRALTAVAVAAGAWLVWRLIAPGGGAPAAATAAVLGWGLGLIPVHVTFSTPRQQAPSRTVRRPAQTYRHEVMRRTAGRDTKVRWSREADND